MLDTYQANRRRLEQTVAESRGLPLDAEQERALSEIVREEIARVLTSLSEKSRTRRGA
jgi:CHASE3 domain sensor protein